MHILDDPSELPERAQDLLRRTGRRESPARFEVPIERWQVRDRAGGSAAASAAEDLDGLVVVPESLVGSSRWRLSDSVASLGQ
ncbi:hypothetical protein ACIPLC_26900 [Kitasatospora sp. NPDC086801]|uniref:hypothetical protein n=1 Tax=Kitasatospora sp. NPDC086801 TaxID=3364066 RepID=UPI00382CD7DF